MDDDEIEYVDWDDSVHTTQPLDASQAQDHDDDNDDDDESDNFFFPEDQLTKLGKGTRRLWRPWLHNIKTHDIRPYSCLHIGDTIEAPVMYPDFRFHYHTISTSRLYLPARIIDVQADTYLIRFSPALSAYGWWPGRIPKGQPIDLIPGSSTSTTATTTSSVENPFDGDHVTIDMDRVRPLSSSGSGGPRPVLGLQSMKPAGWSSFQGVHLGHLEDLLERSLWRSG